jgi:hypothetical protein
MERENMMRCRKVSTRAAERHEYLIVGWRSVGLDARELDHLGPFLGFVSDELSEISGRERERETPSHPCGAMVRWII